jgi:hypothetical protein
MTEWFSRLGEPVAAADREHVREYLRGLELDADLPIASVRAWSTARLVITNPEWDRGWWAAERRESDRLTAKANGARGEGEVSTFLSRALEQSAEAVYVAATAQAARGGCIDAALIRAAAGAASQALHQAQLASLAGETQAHPFSSKQALFAAGHWPLGILGGHYHVF